MSTLKAYKVVGLDNFNASIIFVSSLNAKYDISSRHITMFITHKDIEEDLSIPQKGQEFVEEVNRNLAEGSGQNDWNNSD